MRTPFKPIGARTSNERILPSKSWKSRLLRWIKGERAKEGYIVTVHLEVSNRTASMVEKGDIVFDKKEAYKYVVIAKKETEITLRHVELIYFVLPSSFYTNNEYSVFASAYFEG